MFLCAKRQKGELQMFISAILVLMHVKGGLSICLFVEVTDNGKLIFDAIACTTWINENAPYYFLINLWLVLFLSINWIFVFQYLRVAAVAHNAFNSNIALSVRSSTQISKHLRRLNIANYAFFALLGFSFIITLLVRNGLSLSIYNAPWIILTSCMIFSICKMRRILMKLDQDNYVVNERRMDFFLCLYAIYALIFIGNSVSQIVLGSALDE